MLCLPQNECPSPSPNMTQLEAKFDINYTKWTVQSLLVLCLMAEENIFMKPPHADLAISVNSKHISQKSSTLDNVFSVFDAHKDTLD